jgi:hypothetical protein
MHTPLRSIHSTGKAGRQLKNVAQNYWNNLFGISLLLLGLSGSKFRNYSTALFISMSYYGLQQRHNW